jgi:putative lipoic acid-binding regulatory protein
MNTEPGTLKFPCRIDIKAMGPAHDAFTATVVEIVRRHVPDLAEDAVTTRDSRQGNYVAVTVRVQAESREQMDAIYRELTAHESVTIAL